MGPTDKEEHERRVRLREILGKFELAKLRSLCFDLNIPYEDLRGENRSEKALALVQWCQSRTQLDELEAALALPGTAPQDSPAWREAMERYRERIEETCGWMQILGQAKPVPLDDIFTEVYLLDKPTAWRRFTIEQLQEDFVSREEHERRERRLDGLALVSEAAQVKERQRLFILGKPGAGKTTFLKQVALQAVRQQPAVGQRIPIFITLKRLVDYGKGILDFIVDELTGCQLPVARGSVLGLLRRGDALVLFDGLDEIPQSNKRQASLINMLRTFVQDYPKNQYLVTCRVAADEYLFEGFSYMQVADFTDEQIKSFVSKWFQQENGKRDLFLAELRKPEHRPLRELTTVPLLLAMLCLAFEEIKVFPKQRVELYEEALEVLLRKWDKKQDRQRDEAYHKLHLGRKQQLFAEIAWRSFKQGWYFIPKIELVTHLVEYLSRIPPIEEGVDIDGKAVLKAIEAQHGILVERARHIYAFAHLSFQEYYTARYLKDHLSETMTPSLLAYTSEARWQEVFILLSSLLTWERADDFFNQWLSHLAKLSQQSGVAVWLTWVNAQATEQVLPTLQALAQRSISLYQGLIFESLLNRPSTRALACNLVLNLLHERDLNHHLVLALDQAFLHSLDIKILLDHSVERTVSLSLKIGRERVNKLIHTRSLDRTLLLAFLVAEGMKDARADKQVTLRYFYRQALRDAQTLAQERQLTSLFQELQTLNIPAGYFDFPEWEAKAQAVRILLQTYLDLPSKEVLTEHSQVNLASYLASTQLLLECLEVAFVSDKDAILDALLRPPGWTRE